MGNVYLPSVPGDLQALSAAALLREATRWISSDPGRFEEFRRHLLTKVTVDKETVAENMTAALLGDLSDDIRDGIILKLAGLS